MALNGTFFSSSTRKIGDKAFKSQKEMRKTKIHRLQVQGLTDEEILASLTSSVSHIEKAVLSDLQSLKNDITKGN